MPAGGQRQRLTALALAPQQLPPEHMQVVAQHPVTHVAQVARPSHVQTPVQAVVFQTVDLALHRAVLPAQRHKFLPALPFRFRRVLLPTFGHHHFRNVEAQQLPVGGAGEALVETQARHAARPVAAQQAIRYRHALIHLRFALQDRVVLDQLLLVGGDQQPMPQFHVRALLAFLNPLGVRLKQREHLLVRGNGFLLQQPPVHQVQVLGEHPVEPGQPFPAGGVHRCLAQAQQARLHLGRKRAPHGQIRAHGRFDPRFLVRPAAIDELAGGALAGLELPPPRLELAPARQVVTGGEQSFHQVHALAACVPEQVQIGGEMHVRFQHVRVHLHFKRRAGRAGFFCEHLAACGGDARVDLLQQCVIQQGDLVPQGLMAEDFSVRSPRVYRHAEHLAHEQMMVGQVLHPIPVRVQAEPDDAQHQDLPEVHAGAAGGLLAAEELGFEQGEEVGLERGMHPDPLESGEDGR